MGVRSMLDGREDWTYGGYWTLIFGNRSAVDALRVDHLDTRNSAEKREWLEQQELYLLQYAAVFPPEDEFEGFRDKAIKELLEAENELRLAAEEDDDSQDDDDNDEAHVVEFEPPPAVGSSRPYVKRPKRSRLEVLSLSGRDMVRELVEDYPDVMIPSIGPLVRRAAEVIKSEASNDAIDVVARCALSGWAEYLVKEEGVRYNYLQDVANHRPVGARKAFSNYPAVKPFWGVLIHPSSRRIFVAAQGTDDEDAMVAIPIEESFVSPVGYGYIQKQNFAARVTRCLRVHAPDGVVENHTGLGLLLYASLALLAGRMTTNSEWNGATCIASAGPEGRSDDAQTWWTDQVHRGLARRVKRTAKWGAFRGTVEVITTADVLALGIVATLQDKYSPYASSWRKPPLDVLLATRVDHIPDESFLRYWVGVLEREGATDEQTARYLIDNGHGALLGVDEAPKRFVANRRDAFAKFFGDLVEVD